MRMILDFLLNGIFRNLALTAKIFVMNMVEQWNAFLQELACKDPILISCLSRLLVIHLQSCLNIAAQKTTRKSRCILRMIQECMGDSWNLYTSFLCPCLKRQSENQSIFILEHLRGRKRNFMLPWTNLPVEWISGFVTSFYDGQWWVASVLQPDANNNDVWHSSILIMGCPNYSSILTYKISSVYQCLTAELHGPKKNNRPCLYFNTQGE